MCLPSLPGARWPAGEAIGNRRHPHAGEAFLSDFRSCRRRATTLLAHSRPQPSHHPMLWVNRCKAQNYAASGPEFLVALLHKRDDWFADTGIENGSRRLRCVSGFLAVTDAVNGGNEHSVPSTAEQMVIARSTLAWKGELGNTVLHHWFF